MANTRIKVLDVSGSRVREVDAPDDVAVNRIVALLVEKMSLPLNSPDGQIMSYKLHHRRTGQQLLDGQTLAGAGVIEGDEVRLQPEITAGARA
jgi:WXG100 protein secretion system (Wss), protein YukD